MDLKTAEQKLMGIYDKALEAQCFNDATVALLNVPKEIVTVTEDPDSGEITISGSKITGKRDRVNFI